MSENKARKTTTTLFNEKAQYILAFGIIASMLMVATMPIFVIFFFAVFAYMIFKMISTGSRNEVRDIFEFYLSANEILKNDTSKWFAFEINEVIERGETILLQTANPPPLVYFTLGVLYNKAGDHKQAVRHLSNVLENPAVDESAYAYPTPELQNYVRILRKIERQPAEAPLTFAAIRALERTRRTRGKTLLEESRTKFAEANDPNTANIEQDDNILSAEPVDGYSLPQGSPQAIDDYFIYDQAGELKGRDITYENIPDRRKQTENKNEERNRKSISEVLHDIYDKNVQ